MPRFEDRPWLVEQPRDRAFQAWLKQAQPAPNESRELAEAGFNAGWSTVLEQVEKALSDTVKVPFAGVEPWDE